MKKSLYSLYIVQKRAGGNSALRVSKGKSFTYKGAVNIAKTVRNETKSDVHIEDLFGNVLVK